MYSDIDDKKPKIIGFGDMTPQQLGMKVESSPFYNPPQQPQPETTTNVQLSSEQEEEQEPPAEEEEKGISEEIVSRATDVFEKTLKFIMDNPKIMGGISIVAVLSYMMGKRNRFGDRLKYQKE